MTYEYIEEVPIIALEHSPKLIGIFLLFNKVIRVSNIL